MLNLQRMEYAKLERGDEAGMVSRVAVSVDEGSTQLAALKQSGNAMLPIRESDADEDWAGELHRRIKSVKVSPGGVETVICLSGRSSLFYPKVFAPTASDSTKGHLECHVNQ